MGGDLVVHQKNTIGLNVEHFESAWVQLVPNEIFGEVLQFFVRKISILV